jgi:hypothetical protein
VTTDWNTFLSHQGAVEGRWGATHFRDQPVAPRDAGETWLCDLRYQGLLALTGPDAVKFLQGQITCDVRELGGQRSLLGQDLLGQGGVRGGQRRPGGLGVAPQPRRPGPGRRLTAPSRTVDPCHAASPPC